MLDLLSSINLHILFIQGFDSQIKTLLATALKRHNADLGEFVELFYGKFVCSCEPYLRGGEKSLWKTYLSIAQYVYCGIKSSLMLVSSILSQLYSLENLCLIFFSFLFLPRPPPFPAYCWQVVICPMVFIKYGNVWVTSFPNGFRRELPPPQKWQSNGFISLWVTWTCNP